MGYLMVFLGASRSDARDEFAVSTHEIADQNWTWFFLKNSPLKPDSTDFREKAYVGAVLGANMQSWLVNNNFNNSITPNNYAQLLQALLYGRVDAILAKRSCDV